MSSSDKKGKNTKNKKVKKKVKKISILNINVGVLGHVDSGKTSLVRSLSSMFSTASNDKSKASKGKYTSLPIKPFFFIYFSLTSFCFSIVRITSLKNSFFFLFLLKCSIFVRVDLSRLDRETLRYRNNDNNNTTHTHTHTKQREV